MKGLFKYLKKKEYEKLLGIMKEIKAKPGKVIVEEGSTKREMFYILSGEAEVISEKAGEPLVLATLGEGSFFGEIGLFLRVPRTATVRAKTNMKLLRITPPILRKIEQLFPELAVKIYRAIMEELSRRLAKTTMEVETYHILYSAVSD